VVELGGRLFLQVLHLRGGEHVGASYPEAVHRKTIPRFSVWSLRRPPRNRWIARGI
jgi:hypothetical protein